MTIQSKARPPGKDRQSKPQARQGKAIEEGKAKTSTEGKERKGKDSHGRKGKAVPK
jgi:hypothetical protein